MNKKIVFSIILLVAIFLISGLISAKSIFSQSIRLDEAQSIWVSTKPVTTIIKLIAEDVHVPLYNILLHYWLQLFGASIYAARALSLLFFALTLPVLYLFAYEAGNRKIALLTVMFFAFSPFIIWYTSEARMYTLFTLITSLNHLYFLRLNTSSFSRGKIGYLLTLIIGFYTHYFFIFLVATQGIFVAFKYLHHLYRKKENAPIIKYIGVVGLGFSFFIPWIVYVLSLGGVANTKPLIPPPTSYNILQVFVNFLFGFQPQGIQSVLVSFWPLVVVVFFFLFTQKKKTYVENFKYIVLATFLPIALVLIVSFFKPIFLTRYLILVTPTLFFIISFVIMNFPKRVRMTIIPLLMFSAFFLIAYQNTSAYSPVREDYKGVAEYLQKEAKPTDIIAISAPFTIYPLEYTYKGNARITTIPEWNRYEEGAVPSFSQSGLQAQFNKYEKSYKRVFIVLSYDQGYEDDIRKFLDNRQLLNKKIFSSGLEVLVYKLRYDN